MTDEIAVDPPQIWTFDECAAVDTSKANMKEYKPQGTFYADARLLCGLYGIKLHPIFREPSSGLGGDDAAGGFDDQKRAKEPTTITCMRYRLDSNTMKALFKVLEGCPHVQTLKLQNNGLTYATFIELIGYLNADNCPLVNVFFDWNPIYTDDFKPGQAPQPWQPESDDQQNPWAKLVETSKKLQVVFLRSCNLTDADLAATCEAMKASTTIKVFDISSNLQLNPGSTIETLCDMMSANRSLEYIGLSKLNLNSKALDPIFNMIGRFPFPEDQVEEHKAALKARDAIVEKNKKLKASKKPEEPVPQLDDIFQNSRINENGEEVQEWVTMKNPQLRHVNVCMNKLDNDIEPSLSSIIDRTTEDFSVTISSNPSITNEVIGRLHEKISNLHKAQVEKAIADAEAAGDGTSAQGLSIDPQIHLKRLGV